MVRASAGERARAWNRQKSIADDTNAIALLTSIDAGDTVPNTSGLAGADDMTRSELVAVWNLLELDRTANDDATNRAAMSKAAGINAMISE
jgi:hypothetical protein